MVRRRLIRACRARRAICLTYDDGPGPDLTPRVLELLREHGASATFFLLGKRAEAHPEIVNQTVHEGHDIGCHTYDHLNAWKVAPWRAAADITRGYSALSKWVPAAGAFRPPYGKVTPLTWLCLRRRGAPIGWWTVDSGDTWETPPDREIATDLLVRGGGGVVLLHDFDRGGGDAGSRHTFVLRTTAAVLELARRQGFRLMTLAQLRAEVPRSGSTVHRDR